MAKRILVAGCSNINFTVNTPYVPAPNEQIVSHGKYSFAPSGRGANSAVASAMFGSDVVLCSRVGDDSYGDKLLALFAQSGIDTRYVKVDRLEQTGMEVVIAERSGVNRTILYCGANSRISDADVENAFECYPDAVLTQLDLRSEAVVAAARSAAYDGIPFIVDAGTATPDFPLEKLEKITIFSPNEDETEALTGIRPNNLENCLRASIALCNRVEIGYVVLKLGARGCYVYDGKYCDIISPFEVEVADRIGAGDVFTAALASEFLRSDDITSAAKFANTAAALSVSKKGGIASFPTLEDVLEAMGLD